jgi:hypothetical protein
LGFAYVLGLGMVVLVLAGVYIGLLESRAGLRSLGWTRRNIGRRIGLAWLVATVLTRVIGSGS